MRKIVLLIGVLALTACSESYRKGTAQERLDAAPVVCRDGVEYLADIAGVYGNSYTPHIDYKTDKPFHCSRFTTPR
jgi:hypothetical protein